MFGVACDPDPCDQLCRSTSNRLTECMEDWSMTWDDFDASSKANFRRRCVNRWGEVRSSLESRELEDAREQCQEARAELTRRASEDAECDLLRAMYVE